LEVAAARRSSPSKMIPGAVFGCSLVALEREARVQDLRKPRHKHERRGETKCCC
jgi:hypothetical protein